MLRISVDVATTATVKCLCVKCNGVLRLERLALKAGINHVPLPRGWRVEKEDLICPAHDEPKEN